jgi:receptor expression-enhancing protein 5/6
MKALKSNDKNDDQMWLTYWVIYSFFTVFESIADLALGWIPLYFFAKLGFLVFCFLPQTRGAKLIYEKVLEPVFSQYEGKIQTALKKSN